MNYVKYSAATLAAVFFFALGIYFQSSIPESVREPASLTSGAGRKVAKFDAQVTDAFKACINNNVKDGSLSVTKVIVDRRRWSIVSIPCVGESAKNLYDAVENYSTEELVRYRDRRQGVVRFFGRLYPPSQCVKLISSSRGKDIYEYACSIRIDVDTEITEQLKL